MGDEMANKFEDARRAKRVAKVIVQEVRVLCPHCDNLVPTRIDEPLVIDHTFDHFREEGVTMCEHCGDNFTMPNLTNAFTEIKIKQPR